MGRMNRAGLISLTVGLTLAQGAHTAPSEVLVAARKQVENPAISAVTFRSMDHFFPSEAVHAAREAAVPQRALGLSPPVTMGGKSVSFDEALRLTYTNALLVIREGAIVEERYLNGSSRDDRFMSWSIAKSITSILVGIALDHGLIRSIDDPIDAYLTDLKGTAYEGVTIEQMLMMREGSSYTEQTPVPPSVLEVAKERSVHRNEKRFSDVAGLGLERVNPPGTRFNYSTLTSGILGRLVETASGKSLAQFTEEALWKPAGMADDAYWILDGDLPQGRAMGGGGFNATLRDFGRIGLLMLNGGKANGRQVVSKAWVESSTRYAGTEPVIPGAPRGYQYQWWTMLGTPRFDAVGIHGQFITIDPVTRSVIVKLSYWPEKGGAQYNHDAFALFGAIRAAL